MECFASAGELPISGGWGSAQEDACVIDRNDPVALPGFAFNPWGVIGAFIESCIYMDLVVSRDQDDRYSGISWALHNRETVQASDGRFFEHLTYVVSAFHDSDWESLKDEWEGPNGYGSPHFDHQAHVEKRTALQKNVRFNDNFKCLLEKQLSKHIYATFAYGAPV